MGDIARPSDFCYNCGIRRTGRFCAACQLSRCSFDPAVLTKEYFDGRRALDPADSAVPLSHWLNSTRLVGWLTVGYAAAYVVLAFRSAYGQSFLQAIVKMTVVVMIYGLVFSAVFLGIAIATGGTH